MPQKPLSPINRKAFQTEKLIEAVSGTVDITKGTDSTNELIQEAELLERFAKL